MLFGLLQLGQLYFIFLNVWIGVFLITFPSVLFIGAFLMALFLFIAWVMKRPIVHDEDRELEAFLREKEK